MLPHISAFPQATNLAAYRRALSPSSCHDVGLAAVAAALRVQPATLGAELAQAVERGALMLELMAAVGEDGRATPPRPWRAAPTMLSLLAKAAPSAAPSDFRRRVQPTRLSAPSSPRTPGADGAALAAARA